MQIHCTHCNNTGLVNASAQMTLPYVYAPPQYTGGTSYTPTSNQVMVTLPVPCQFCRAQMINYISALEQKVHEISADLELLKNPCEVPL